MDKIVPLIYLAFSREEKNRHLPLLQDESKSISKYLQRHNENDLVRIYRNNFVDRKHIIEDINHLKDDITIFHFSGHSSEEDLLWTNPDDDLEPGLSEMLGKLKNLKLVFLSGCSSNNQVRKLLEEGVPIVISTSAPIGDPRAAKFAKFFYQSLVSNNTIQSAFDSAYSKIRSILDIEIEKSGSLLRLEREGGTDYKWGLYYKHEKSNILDWKLPIIKYLEPTQVGNEKIISRHTKVSFPEKCYLNEKVKLLFQLTVNKPNDTKFEKKLPIKFDAGRELLELYVIVTSPGFLIDPRMMKITLPVDQDSEIAQFVLTPVTIGDQIIELEIYMGSKRICYLLLCAKIKQNGK